MADWTHAAGATTTAGSGSTIVITISAGVGTVPVGTVFFPTAMWITSIQDSAGNTNYGVVPPADDLAAHTTAGFYSKVPLASSITSITVTVSGGSIGFGWGTADVFTPPTGATQFSVDGTQILLGNAALAMSPFQTLHNDTLIYVGAFNTAVTTVGAGFTAGAGSGTNVMSEFAIQATASAAVTPTFASNTGQVWAIAFGIKPVAQNTWELRQRFYNRTPATVSSAAFTLNHTVASGSFICGTFAFDVALSVVSIVDDKSNTYSITNAGSNGRQAFKSNGLITNGPQTITITLSGSSSILYAQINEFIPPPSTSSIAVDGTPTNTTASLTSTSVTTTKNGDLCYAMGDDSGINNAISGGFSQSNGSLFTWTDAYFIQPAAGAISTTWTVNSAGSDNVSMTAYSVTLASGLGLLCLMGMGQ